MTRYPVTFLTVAALAVAGSAGAADAPPLTAGAPIQLPGKAGSFDFMAVDRGMHRLLAAHKGAGTLEVLDLETEKVLPAVPTGAAQGVAVDARDNRIFVGDEDEKKVVALDRKTLQPVGEVAVTGPVDCVAFDAKHGMVYADHDDGTEAWVIDPVTLKIVATVTLPGAPEVVEYDRVSDRLYQNVKVDDTVQVIDPDSHKVVAVWPTAPAKSPHGLALDRRAQRLFTAGNNGKLLVIDMKTGKPLQSVDIAPGVDQIAFDRGNRRIYCSCRGMISVVQETDDGATLLGGVPAPRGAHTIAVDPTTHAVWTCYAEAEHSYLMKFTVGGGQ